MNWPLLTRRVHDLELEALRRENATLSAERSYWKCRAEELIDAGLARAGAIHQPTMVQRPKDRIQSAAAMLTSAFAVQEIDSSKRKADA